MKTVAALFVDRNGPYPSMPDVDAWTIERDARYYAGPHPVVAHPPCGAWGTLRHLASRSLNEKDCGPSAVNSVFLYGGALEQPAKSKLWEHCGLPLPFEKTNVAREGFSISVQQVAWGHVARKSTWLFFFGIERDLVLAGIRRGGTPTHWVSGSRRRKGGAVRGGLVPLGIKVCSDEQRRRTPVLFAQWLVSLAREAA